MRERIAVQGLMAIAAREVSERVALLGLALVVAGVPFIGPWIGIGDRPLLGVLLGVVMVLAAAVLTGSSVIASDLAERRLGFFRSRPREASPRPGAPRAADDRRSRSRAR